MADDRIKFEPTTVRASQAVQDALANLAGESLIPKPVGLASRALGPSPVAKDPELLQAIRDQVRALDALAEATRRHNELLAANTLALERHSGVIEESWRRYDEAEAEGNEWKDAE